MSSTGAPGLPGDLSGLRLARTELGQQEISARRLNLSRPARNLLLIIDPKRIAADWLGMVRGTSADDLQLLLDNGLVAPWGATTAPAPAPAAPVTSTTPAAPAALAAVATGRMSLAAALQAQGYRLLYDRMTAEARPQMGLFRSYKLILEIERCDGPDALRALALRFVEQVRGLHGDAQARALAQRLADPE